MKQFVTVSVDELQGQSVEKPTTVANDESKRWRGGPSSQSRIEERVNFAYALLLRGDTRHSRALEASKKFNISLRTAHEDIKKAMELLSKERSEDRAELLNIITANRLSLLNKAVRKGNYQVACHILDSLGRAAGELEAVTEAQAAPVLRVEIDDKRNG